MDMNQSETSPFLSTIQKSSTIKSLSLHKSKSLKRRIASFILSSIDLVER